MSQFDGNREQKQKKAARMGRKWWKAAVPAAAALVLVAGSCWVGDQEPDQSRPGSRNVGYQSSLYTAYDDYDSGSYPSEEGAYDMVVSNEENAYARKPSPRLPALAAPSTRRLRSRWRRAAS